MDKKLYKKRYSVFCEVLKRERTAHHITQVELARKMSEKQSWISKIELGKRRLELIKLLEYCDKIGITLTDFMFRMEGRLLEEGLLSPGREKEYLKWLSIYNERHNIRSIV